METWKPIPIAPRYEVSDAGNVRSATKRWRTGPFKPMRPELSHLGYHRVSLFVDGKYSRHSVHRLVMLAFVGPSDLGVNHKNGIKTDNRLANLEYASQQENVIHYRRVLGVGADNRGQKHPLAKLGPVDIQAIKALWERGHRQRSIAEHFNINQGTVSRIVNGKRWNTSATSTVSATP